MGINMKISILQLDVKMCNLEKNYITVKNMITKASEEKADIVCIPEMWNIGFLPIKCIDDYCDDDGKITKNMFSSLAVENNVNIIAGSVANKRLEKTYNTSFIFDRKGNCVAEYDKIHLFSNMNEDKAFNSGNKIVTFEIDGIKCGIIICYDLRFVELSRKLALEGIKILFVVAQWPKERIEHWEILNRARAIENQIFVVAANGCGKFKDIKYGGNSLIISPQGKILSKGKTKEGLISYDIDINEIDLVRSKLNVFADRKEELYNNSL